VVVPAAPHTPVNWTRKRNKVLGNLSTFQSLLVQCLEVYLQGPEAPPSDATGLALVSVLSALFGNLALANTVKEAVTSLVRPLALFYERAAGEPPPFSPQLLGKVGSSVRWPILNFFTRLYSRLAALLLPAGQAALRGPLLPAEPLGAGVRRRAAGAVGAAALRLVPSQEQAAPRRCRPVLERHLRQLAQPHVPRRDQVDGRFREDAAVGVRKERGVWYSFP